jgi:hypothetical protein
MRAAAESELKRVLLQSLYDVASVAVAVAVGLSLAIATLVTATSQSDPVGESTVGGPLAPPLSGPPAPDR